jgi:NADPH:quinone reductase-like Zn-dependent oxidoreductase
MRKKEQRMRDLIEIRDMLASKKLTTVIDRVYPIDEIQTAHAYVDSGRKRGNVLVTMNA